MSERSHQRSSAGKQSRGQLHPSGNISEDYVVCIRKMQYPRVAGSSAHVELVILEDIPIIYQHYSDFSTEKKTSEDRSE